VKNNLLLNSEINTSNQQTDENLEKTGCFNASNRMNAQGESPEREALGRNRNLMDPKTII
jgi:hypothetical protein